MRIAITGGKGGTGKSTVATALAYELSKHNKVLLIDADVDCPNDHLILSIIRKKERDVFQTIPKWEFSRCTKCGRCSEVCKSNAIVFVKERYPIFVAEQCNGCEACILTCPQKAIVRDKKKIGTIYSGKLGKLDFVSGELEPAQPISEFVVDAVKQYVEKIENSYDFIIIDTSAGTHCGVITSLIGCDLALAVTEPTPFGAHDLSLILELISILNIPKKIVLNRSDIGDRDLIKEMAIKYNTEIVAEIPYSKSFLEAFSKGKPIEDSTIKKLAKNIKGLRGI